MILPKHLRRLFFLLLPVLPIFFTGAVPFSRAAEKINHAPGPSAPAPGLIVVDVTYRGDGSVQTCRVVRSNAPFELEASTLDYIRKHWKCPVLAGATAVYPIDFENPPTPKYWNGDLPVPPDLYPAGHLTEKLTLRINFGGDGWASHVAITSPTGDPNADYETALWVRVHWHHAAYANQTVEAPFAFVPTPPTLPPPPVHDESPPEPAAIPAIRVE